MSADPSAPAPTTLGATAQPQATPDRPWLGLAHFTEADRDYFYGRDSEVRELTDRVRRAPLTVLYGVSGYGKSSIIGAGLIPALGAAGHPIVLLRRCYDDLALRPLQADVIAACVAAIPGCKLPELPDAPTLWEFFHDRSQPWFQRATPAEDAEDALREPSDSTAWPVLILDQFEEIFIKGEDRATKDATADARAREAAGAFLAQLADLVENRPPAALRERLQSGQPEERRALVGRFNFQARPVRVALAVRDDFLTRLERSRRAMPSLMEHRVELRLLSGPQAYKAVFEPGTKRPGLPPILPEDVAEAIVRAAAGAAPDVPLEEIDVLPPILSLLCERLNDRRLAASPPPASIIAADFSAGEARSILGRFYDDKLRHHPKARDRRRKAIAWIVASLAVAGVSLSLAAWAQREKARAYAAEANANRQTYLVYQQREKANAKEKEAESEKAAAEAATREAEKQVAREREKYALDLYPLRLHPGRRCAVARARLLENFDEHQRMGYYIRKAQVHLAAVERYKNEIFDQVAKDTYISWERVSAAAALKEALRLGDSLAAQVGNKDDRGVSRDRILAHFLFATLSTQLEDSKAAAEHLQAARALLDALVQAGPYSAAQLVDWMGLPNLDAAVGDRAAAGGDKKGAREWYQKALALQTQLVARRPGDKTREEGLEQIKKRLKETAPNNP